MATFQAKTYQQQTDPETGCIRGYNDYEECRQNYFLKQQNEILKNQQSSSDNENGDSKVIGTTTEAQVQGQANSNLATVEVAAGGISPSLTYVVVLVAAIIATAVLTRYFTKKKEENVQVVFFRKNPIKPKDDDKQ